MPDIDVYFHALREETGPWLQCCADDLKLHSTLICFPPYQAREAAIENLSEEILAPTVLMVYLTRTPPSLPLVAPNQFDDQNPSALRFILGVLNDKGLSGSWMSARTSDQGSLAIWRTISRRLKAWTSTGAFIFNTINRSSGPSKNHRFSAGARKLDMQGIPLYEGNGTHVFRFIDH